MVSLSGDVNAALQILQQNHDRMCIKDFDWHWNDYTACSGVEIRKELCKTGECVEADGWLIKCTRLRDDNL